MGAITIAALVICSIAITYLYVMGLCYLCDLYTLSKQKKQEAAEKRRKEELRLAREQAEMKREQDMELRKQRIKARRERVAANNRTHATRVGSGKASAAGA